MKKKLLQKLFILCLVFALTVNSSALVSNEIYPSSEQYTAAPNETLEIPMNINNNTGIMGFRITVSYPSSALKNPVVKRGTSLTKGNFVTSIDEHTNRSFDILWNNSENVYVDGELFVLLFEVRDDAAAKDYQIELTYNADDTFNEQWQSVSLSMNNISINIRSDINNGAEVPNAIQRLIAFLRNLFSRLLEVFKGQQSL